MDEGGGEGHSTAPQSQTAAASYSNMDATVVVVPEDNLMEQRDEVLAIDSIFGDDEEERVRVVNEPDEQGHGLFHLQIKIPVLTPSEMCHIDLMLPASETASPSTPVQHSPMDTGKGAGLQEEGGATAVVELQQEGGATAGAELPEQGVAETQEGGARAQTPPPDIGKGVALQRSLSGQRWTGSFSVHYLHPLTLHLTLPPNYPSQAPPAFALSCVWLRNSQLSALCKQLDLLWETTPNLPIIFSWVDWLEKESLSHLGLTDRLVLMPESEGTTEDDDVDGRAMSECTELGQAVHNLLQYSNQREAVEFCKSVQECCLCFDEKQGTKFFRLEPCKHHFCYDCIATHCNLHVAAGTIQLLTCPDTDCKTMISPDILQAVLTSNNFIRWETLSLQRSLDEMEDVVYCPRCQSVVIREQDADLHLGYCLTCCFSFCTECDQPWHQGTVCTSELERLEGQAQRNVRDQRTRRRYEELMRQAEEKAKTMLTVKSKTVPCPHCKVPVEKIEGCNKMTCRCGNAFCWLCGKGIRGYDHFTSSSCVLFRYTPEPVQARVNQRRPPAALLWMQAQAEVQGAGRQDMRCVQCKQTNYKLQRNNHIRCWNCKTNLCFMCNSRITGTVTQHFIAAGCSQHS